MTTRNIILLLSIICWSCNHTAPAGRIPKKNILPSSASWEPPPPGATVDSFSQRITEDKLNELYFQVIIKSGPKSSDSACYDLRLAFGMNRNHMTLQLPEWTNQIVLRPAIRSGKGNYHCFVGFFAADTTFHPLYEITVENKDLICKQIHAYYLK